MKEVARQEQGRTGDMLGIVQHGEEIGALARNKATGNLVMMRAGTTSMLHQRKAQAAINAGACLGLRALP